MGGFRPVSERATAVFLRSASGALAIVAALAFGGSRAEAWVTALPGEVSRDVDAPALARDPAGDVLGVVAGAASKYDGASGALLWRSDAPDDDGPADRAIVADARGDAVIRSVRYLPAVGLSIVKYSGGDGRRRWRFDDTAGLVEALPPLVDGNGDVLVIGTLGGELAAIKLRGTTGARLWLSRIPAISRHVADAAAIDAHGDVAVAGFLDDGKGDPVIVSKISGADGHRLWFRLLDAGARLAGIGFDEAGDVLAGGGKQFAINQPIGFLVLKLDGATGDVRWRDLSVPGSPYAFAVDRDGSAVVVGGPGAGFGRPDIVVARWNPDGSHAWQRSVAPQNVTFQQARGVVAADGAVVIGARVVVSDIRSGFLVVALDAADGADRWRLQRDGDGGLEGLTTLGPAALVADGAAAVFVSAAVPDEGSGFEATVARLALDDGRELWSRDARETTRLVDDVAASLALDPDGDLIAGGILGSPVSGRRVAAVKLSATDGHELWRSTVDGLEGSGRVEVDPAGDVVASGRIKVGPPVPDGGPFTPGHPAPVALTVVKLAGDDGHEVWRYVHRDGLGAAILGRTVVDRVGDVLTLAEVGPEPGLKVIKIDGEHGSLVWSVRVGPRQHLFESLGEAPLIVDAAGDAIAAAANAPNSPTSDSSLVVKVRGGDGAIAWSTALPGRIVIDAMALDASGDVVVSAYDAEPATTRVVRKLAGATGALLWATDIGSGEVGAVTIDAGGDVLVAGRSAGVGNGSLSVVKLDGATGGTRWTQRAPVASGGIARAVTASAAGDVFIAGRFDAADGPRLEVLALSGPTGAPTWIRTFPASAPSAGSEGRDVLLDGRGRVVAAGALRGSEETGLDFGVVSLDATTGGDGTECRFPRSCGFGPRLRVPTSGWGRLPRH